MIRLISIFVLLQASYLLTAQVSIKESPIKIFQDFSNTNFSKTIDINFTLVGGLILLNAENDGKEGKYILDTGAPCMILNEIVDDSKKTMQAIGISGKMNVFESHIEKFKLGKFTREKIDCVSLDISHIEKLKQTKIAGLIGYDMFKEEELLFDYENSMISFLNENKLDDYKGKKRLKRLPFKLFGHIPIIHVKIGKKNFNFGIDTGSEVNVINGNDYRRIKKSMYQDFMSANIHCTDIQCVGTPPTDVVLFRLPEITVGKQESYVNLNFIVKDLSRFNEAYGVELDGLLGYAFLKERLHSIDFRNKELVIWNER